MTRLTCLKPRVGAAPKSRLAVAGHEREHATGSAAWKRIRHAIMTRDCGMCQACLKLGVFTLAAEVDHIEPVFEGGSDDDHNLQALCRPCHTAKTNIEAGRRAAGGMTW
jgi:5-methylcytosine-specific restriction protein A